MGIKIYIKRALKYIISGVPEEKVCPQIAVISPNDYLKGRVALITGGTSGIGFEIAKAFINAGANVVITGRSEEKLRDAVERLKEKKRDNVVESIVLNNRDVKSFPLKLQDILSLQGIQKIDILVNNAGILTYDTVAKENERKYDEVFETNLKGPFFLSQVIGRYMKDNHINGNILNIASSSSLRPAASAYTMTKWGIRGFTLGLAKMLAPYGITVNGLAPGQTLTAMVKNKVSLDNIYNGRVPLKRYILPEEIANLAVFLVSDCGKAIMGDVVYMTGGAGLLTFEDISYAWND